MNKKGGNNEKLDKTKFQIFYQSKKKERGRENRKIRKTRKIFSFIIPHKNTNKLIKMEDNAFGLNRFER